MISDDKISEVRERAGILEVVADYVRLRKSGANYQGLCPFHGEKTPSFNVNPARGIFHCFGCGVGGNIFSFVMKMEGLSFPEAVTFLAKRVGVTIEERSLTPAEQERQSERDLLFRVTELAARYYRRVLLEEPAGEAGRAYLVRRGVDPETAEAYRLGFAPDRWEGLARWLESQKAPLALAEKLGLIRKKSGGSGFYDLLRNRLIFPIADVQGRPVGFGGRVLDDALPKYLNSPESPIYHKGEILFGLHLAKGAMREQGTAIIVEGYFDHLALYQAGVRNVVATCGTALTEGHAKLLQRYAGKLFTLFDGDSAGKKATFRAMDLLLAEGIPASVIELPAGEDPDSFVRKEGAAVFASQVVKARPALDYFFRDLLATTDCGTVEGKVRVVEVLAPRLEKLANPVERELYLKEIARVLGIDLRTLQRKLGRGTLTTADLAPRRDAPRQGADTEDLLLALIGKYPEVARLVREYGIERLFTVERLGLAEAILGQAEGEDGVDWALVLDQVAVPEERSRLAALFVNDEHLSDVDPRRAFDQCRRDLERKSLQQSDQKALQRELAGLDPDSPRYWEILRELDTLRNRKSQLL